MKPLTALNETTLWKAKTASDGLLIKYSDEPTFVARTRYRFPADYNRMSFIQPLEGFCIIVHSPDEYPVNIGTQHNEFTATSSSVTITPEIFILDDAFKSWPIEKRNCYLPSERNLTLFRMYTKSNCEHECLSFAIEEKCGCLPYYIVG